MTHKTKDGRLLLLAELEDTHLLNIIKLKLLTFEEARHLLEDTRKRNKFAEALYGEFMNEEDAKAFVAGFDRNIAPYIVEALIRGLDVSIHIEHYQSILGRSSKVTLSAIQRRRLISDGAYDGYEDEDED